LGCWSALRLFRRRLGLGIEVGRIRHSRSHVGESRWIAALGELGKELGHFVLERSDALLHKLDLALESRVCLSQLLLEKLHTPRDPLLGLDADPFDFRFGALPDRGDIGLGGAPHGASVVRGPSLEMLDVRFRVRPAPVDRRLLPRLRGRTHGLGQVRKE